MQSRFGAYRLERTPQRLTIRRATRKQTLAGCLVALACFALSYIFLFASVFFGQASLSTANLSLGVGGLGLVALLWPFGSFRSVSLVLDRDDNEIRRDAKRLIDLDRVRQIVVLSREAVFEFGTSMLRREQLVVYAEGEPDRIELALLRDRAEANRLAEAIAEFLQVPIDYEQGGDVQFSDAEADD